MNKNDYYINIADIIVHIKIPFLFEITSETINFICNPKKEDIFFEFIEINEPIVVKGNCVFQNIINIYETEGEFINEFFLQPGYDPYAWRIKISDSHYEIRYLKGKERYFSYSENIIKALSLEQILNKNNSFILHSSLISWKDKGILFSAPSGTGKSTQADLWEKYENAEVINGDKAGIRKINDTWKAYGLPFAGSSNIFKNKNVDISCILILRQGEENKLEYISEKDAFIKIYSETTIHTWDKEYQNKTIEQITDLVKSVPIYIYKCLPNRSSVDYLKMMIEEKIV